MVDRYMNKMKNQDIDEEEIEDVEIEEDGKLPQGTQLSLKKRVIYTVCLIIIGAGLVWGAHCLGENVEKNIAYSSSVQAISSTVPYVYGALILLAIYNTVWGYSKNTEEENSFDDYWVKYGKHLKLAYTSKFGGGNKGFDEEVDARVLVMQNNGSGWTRTLAKDWLKRMHNFTEAK